MSEQSSEPKKTATKKPSSRQNPRTVGPKKNDLIGVILIAIGLALIVGVGAYAYLKQNGSASVDVASQGTQPQEAPKSQIQPAQHEDKQPEQQTTQSACLGCSSRPQFIMPPLPDDSHLFKPTHPEIKGTWVTHLPDGIAEVIFAGSAFQVIYSGRSDSDFRKYTRGYYSFNQNTGVASLRPAYKLGPPDEPRDVVYQVLTLQYFDVILRRSEDGRSLYWLPPPEKVATKQIFPLMLYTGVQDHPFLKWDKVK
ncbi:MAG: hypothetical protein H6858_08810 [Rhodospirillales bacterium]|nr:hypothetical protein [Alphaproteobacteria bacterium]MCB9977683.1 hypothetical protein [Rhodospirillales bacterium]